MTASSFIIRPARDDDRDALIEQFQGLNVYEEPIIGNRRLDRAGGEESLIAAEKRVAAKDGVRLVAESGGKVVGHLFMVFGSHEVYVRADRRRHAHVTELFVREEARGRGLGRALLAEAERLAVAGGVDHLTIGVLIGNMLAERAYARFGFRSFAAELVKPIGKAAS